MTIDVIFTALLPQTIDQKMSFTFFTQSKFKPSKSRAVQVSWPPPNRDESTPTPTGCRPRFRRMWVGAKAWPGRPSHRPSPAASAM